MVTSSASGPSYAKSYHWDQTELLYKLLKWDAKLVRSVLEISRFRSTDFHDWNVLWINSSLNSYMKDFLKIRKSTIFHVATKYFKKLTSELTSSICIKDEYKAFNIIPDTYMMPDEYSDFSVHFNELNREAPYNTSKLLNRVHRVYKQITLPMTFTTSTGLKNESSVGILQSASDKFA